MEWGQEIPWTADRSTTEGRGTTVPRPFLLLLFTRVRRKQEPVEKLSMRTF